MSSYEGTRKSTWNDLEKLVEVQQKISFLEELKNGDCGKHHREQHRPLLSTGLDKPQVRRVLNAGLSTFLLHVESRIASACGQGFYTIGPCGEEMLGAVGEALRPSDAVALHYRHLSTSLTRSLGTGKSFEEIFLDRARGYTVSSLDPVTGGGHCALGGGSNDFIVTSTLASQAPPAVGRALGIKLSNGLNLSDGAKFPNDAVSYVSVGDGSVNNAHFLAAMNLAEYAQHRGFKCPVVFGISDNGLCISLKGHGWIDKFFENRFGMATFACDGNDMADVYRASTAAVEFSRAKGVPCAVIFKNLTRRFGHAATDRQFAYLEGQEIESAATENALAGACHRAVKEGIVTYPDLVDAFENFDSMIFKSFAVAAKEPKVTSRKVCISRNSQPLAKVPKKRGRKKAGVDDDEKPQVMRKHMTRVFEEQLQNNDDIVYIGEDVQHGGYYLVTEGLHKKFPLRVADFPPDETTLLGVAMGYSQVGMVPIVEIPYSKYLDCGADMFFEAVVSNWVSGGKAPNGMVIRLQGFDKGVFGGNFHTHNSLYLPPGLDVVAYSNGHDYVRGMRYALHQARAGRVVMTVDSTDILNRRHVFDRDNRWMTKYPTELDNVLDFDTVILHGDSKDKEEKDLAIVTYGNGVPTAMLAQQELEGKNAFENVTVVDCPTLSAVPSQLKEILPQFRSVVFADVCKLGQHPHAGMITSLQQDGLLPGANWQSVAASPTYNPLGNLVTFLSVDDIVEAAEKLA
jgi:2-oxoisovalerate dehydrogenase E1 component|eukprot:g2826.t1